MEKSNINALLERIEKEKNKFEAVKQKGIQICNAYLKDLEKRKATLLEKSEQIAKELEALKAKREECAKQITMFQSTGEIEQAADAEDRMNELDEKIAKKERLQGLCNPKVVMGSPKLYEKVKQAHEEIMSAQSEMNIVGEEIKDEINLEINRLKEIKDNFEPKELWRYEHLYQRVYKAQNGRE